MKGERISGLHPEYLKGLTQRSGGGKAQGGQGAAGPMLRSIFWGYGRIFWGGIWEDIRRIREEMKIGGCAWRHSLRFVEGKYFASLLAFRKLC